MAQDRAKLLLQQGITAAKAGQKNEAFQLLQQTVKLDPRNETAWLWLSSVARTDQERVFCLKQLLAINPQSDMAIKGLKALGVEAEAAKQQVAAPQSTVPLVSPEKLGNVQTALDELLRTYSPELYTPLEIEWVHKERNRYGEGAARRLKTSVYLAAAAGVILLLVLVGVLAVTVLSNDDNNVQQGARFPTFTPSFTPSITPTPTQIVNTPLPPGQSTPTAVPIQAGLARGNAQVNPTATLPYPPYNASIRTNIQPAVLALNAGNYQAAAQTAGQIRTSQQTVCYQEAYYYEALGLAGQGGRARLDQAEQILTEGINAQRDPGFDNTCQNSDLLRAGMCYIKFQKAIDDPNALDQEQLNQAISFCNTAHQNDPRLVPAAENLAHIYTSLGDTASLNNAFTAVEETLNADPSNRSNTVLLLTLADIEMARARYQQALAYIETALYVDPTLEIALQKRVEAHLLLAGQEAPGSQQQIIRYGIAATFAEYYLFYYPGSPAANILMAEARLREGNTDRALESINQVLNIEGELPATAGDTVRRAYTLRAEIYESRQDWENLLADLEQLRSLQPNNSLWITKQANTLLALARYGDALALIDALREDDSSTPDLTLAAAHILSRICTYEEGLECDYERVVEELLTDTFIASLPAESPQRLDAESYRLEADFALLREEDVDTDDEDAVAAHTAALEALRDQLLTVVTSRETAEDYYLLGRLYHELSQNRAAATAFEWVAYWNQFYSYPFAEQVTQALADARELAETETIEDS